MITKPTEKQAVALKELFFAIMALGFTCGLDHPIECYVDYVRHLPQFVAEEEVAKYHIKATQAMAYFFRNSACCPEEEAEYNQLSDHELVTKADLWYHEMRQSELLNRGRVSEV